MKTEKKSHKKRKKRGQWIKKGLTLLFSLCLLFAVACASLYIYLRTQALPAVYIPQTTKIYDVNGSLIDSYYDGQNRQTVPLDQISPHVIQAVLAIEDHRYYDHFGIDLQGLGRAIVVNAIHMDKVQGGSTITQQLARNLYLTHERTWSRKIKEGLLALKLEMMLSKDEILEKYLNQIYYGHAVYGIQAAAVRFFGKNASELTLAESALLAGVPKGPKYYSPYMNMENAKRRQRLVLNAMAEQGFITREEADAAYEEPLNLLPLTAEKPQEKAPYFRDYIRQFVIRELGVSEQAFERGGLQIYTTLDARAQKIAEDVVQKHLGETDLQVALVAIDPRNGHVKAMVGGKNYQENQYNRVFAKTRQPGSTFKAFVYLTALMSEQWTPLTKIESKPTVFTYDEGRKTYAPDNFAEHYFGWIDLRTAIAKSDNIYAVTTLMALGPEKVIETARLLGIESPLQAVPSLALGTSPISPFEMASAYSVIANGGVRAEPLAVLRIEDSRGNVLYEAEPRLERVVDSKYTYVLTKLMEQVFEPGGTGHRVAHILKRPVAAKTGTTHSDAWMVGFTPELSTAVWIGYDRDRDITTLQSHLAAPIFAEFMEQTLSQVPPKIFPIPADVVSLYIDPETGKIARARCPDVRLEVFVRGTEPAEYCDIHGGDEHGADGNDGQGAGQNDHPSGKPHRSWWDHIKRWWNG